MLKSVQWKWRILPNIIKNLNFFKNGFKKKSALGGFGLEGFWIAHTIYLMDFGVPKMGFLVLVLGVIERGVSYDYGVIQSTWQWDESPSEGLIRYISLLHPSLDNPQKKNQKTHLGDPKIHQVNGVGYPKTFETKSF